MKKYKKRFGDRRDGRRVRTLPPMAYLEPYIMRTRNDAQNCFEDSFDITETDKGTYILNANDMCMAEHLDQMAAAGVDSIKIEGRAKSHYYVAVTTNAYRGALDSLNCEDINSWKVPEWVTQELNKISHRNYSTGFYFGNPQGEQTYKNAGYVRDYAVAAGVEDYKDGRLVPIMKNKFSKGQIFDCLEPQCEPFTVVANEIFNEKGEIIDVAPHPMMKVLIPFDRPIKKGALLRMKTE